MQKLILTLGLPASGKSTWAKAYSGDKENNTINVCKDDLRGMLKGDSDEHNSQLERFVESARDHLTLEALKKGKNVIWSDTNFAANHKSRAEEIAAEIAGTQVVIKDFTNVTLSECLKRNKLREHPVPEKVIRMMYTQYVLPNLKPKEFDKNLPKAAVFDIDGTIATMTNRSPYDATRYYDDAPIESMIDLVKMYIANNHHIIFLTGRHEAGRATTIKWLKDKAGIEPKDYTLLMREDKDKTPDFEYKEVIFKERVEGKYYVPIWFEDRQRNVDMARNKLGINALQIGDGDF